jgi:hypothetical protein
VSRGFAVIGQGGHFLTFLERSPTPALSSVAVHGNFP